MSNQLHIDSPWVYFKMIRSSGFSEKSSCKIQLNHFQDKFLLKYSKAQFVLEFSLELDLSILLGSKGMWILFSNILLSPKAVRVHGHSMIIWVFKGNAGTNILDMVFIIFCSLTRQFRNTWVRDLSASVQWYYCVLQCYNTIVNRPHCKGVLQCYTTPPHQICWLVPTQGQRAAQGHRYLARCLIRLDRGWGLYKCQVI